MKTFKIKLNNITSSKKDLIFNYIDKFNYLSNYFVDLLWNDKNNLMLLEKQKRNYIRDHYVNPEIKKKYHSHFIQEALIRVVSLIKNENIINKPIFNGNDIIITKFLGNIVHYENSKLTKYWFHITIKHDNINKRIKIPLSNKFNIDNYKKTYHLQRINDDLYLILFQEENKNKLKKNNESYNVLGVDVGYVDLFALSNGKIYGNNFKEKISDYSEHVNNKQKNRNKLYQIAKKNKAKNPNKYLNIKRNNLGKKKQINNNIKNRGIIKTFINTSLNKIFEENDMLILVNEHLKFKKKGFNKKHKKDKDFEINRKLSFWMNGEIKKSIKTKTKENGVFLCSINAWNTSQECSHCGYIDKDNRNGKEFKCKSCGFKYDSDLNAAKVIIKRLRTDQPRLQKLTSNIVKYWKVDQSESELYEKLIFI